MTAATLFPLPRRPRRVLMRVVDAGLATMPHFVNLECPKCGHNDGWREFMTEREAVSQPCPACNGGGG